MAREALIPRGAAIVVALFLGLFAADAFGEGASVVDRLTNVVLHLLPSLAVLGVLIVAWRSPVAGAVLYVALALASLVLFRRRLSGVVLTTVPFLALAGLFLWSALAGRDRAR